MLKLFTLLLFSLISCKKYFQYSPNEVRLEESEKNLNQKNIAKIQSLPTKDSFSFIVTGDTQRFYEELDEFVIHVNARNDISFVIINGDISDFGQNMEFKWIARSLAKLKIPYIAVIGNHDMLANGRQIFNQMFGPDNFSFSYGNYKFICLNSNSREKGFDGSLPDLNWLNTQLSQLSHSRQAFVFSHVPPFNQDFDQNLVQPFATALALSGKVNLSIHGHHTVFSISKPYGPDVEYVIAGSVNKNSYALISVHNEFYNVRKVDF